MKQGVVIATYVLGAALLPLAAAADPAATPAAPAPAVRYLGTSAEAVVAPVNRGLFDQCAAGRDAATAIAQRRDSASLAAADAAFARCTRTSKNMDGVASAELGIAATAFLAALGQTGDARRTALGRAADYAERADEDFRSYHGIGIPTSDLPATPTVQTQQGTDTTQRVEVGLPGGPAAQNNANDPPRVPDQRPPAPPTRPSSFERLALGIVAEAHAQLARIAATK